MSDDDYVLFDQKETSLVTRVALNTLKDWRAKGGIKGPPSAVIGGRVMYRKVDVYRWINEQFEQSGKGSNKAAAKPAFTPLGNRAVSVFT